VNVYAVEAEDGLALIDSGWRTETTLQELDDALAQIGRSHADVRDVYVTHMHRDHYTMALELRRRQGTRVHMGEREHRGVQGVIRQNSNVPGDYLKHVERGGALEIAEAARHVTAAEPFYAKDWELPDTWMTPGSLCVGYLEAQVIATPGHTRGHQVFQAPQLDITFTGDHVLPTITPSIGFEHGDWDSPLRNFLDSLGLMLKLPDTRMLPSHGWPTESVHERCHELLAHHEERFDAVMSTMHGSQYRTALDVAKRIGWTRKNRHFDELDVFNQMIAVSETIAHLDDLADRGILATDNASVGQRFYRAI
jgi:glyoxylase-like metal-dependent hydrolase (beta-lactamase superfamily II)